MNEPDKVECLTCSRMTLRGAPMARHGFGQCDLKPASTHVSVMRPLLCPHHQAAPAAIVEKRREWASRAENRAPCATSNTSTRSR